MKADQGKWRGQTALCIASGPSLTAEDCELAQASGHKIIAVNSSWQMAPRCDVLYAGDYAWWKQNVGELTIEAERWTTSRNAQQYGAKLFLPATGYNSGLAAIHLANWLGAERILLLGYDCAPKDGQLHWHGAHRKTNNPNAISFGIWRRQFKSTPVALRAKVVNCSRETAITVFRRLSLEQALQTAPLNDEALLFGS